MRRAASFLSCSLAFALAGCTSPSSPGVNATAERVPGPSAPRLAKLIPTQVANPCVPESPRPGVPPSRPILFHVQWILKDAQGATQKQGSATALLQEGQPPIQVMRGVHSNVTATQKASGPIEFGAPSAGTIRTETVCSGIVLSAALEHDAQGQHVAYNYDEITNAPELARGLAPATSANPTPPHLAGQWPATPSAPKPVDPSVLRFSGDIRFKDTAVSDSFYRETSDHTRLELYLLAAPTSTGVPAAPAKPPAANAS